MPEITAAEDRSSGTLSRRELLARAGAAIGAGVLLPDQLAAATGAATHRAPAPRARGKGAPGDIVFTNTIVVTGDPNRAQLRNVALAISGTTIAAIGPTEEVLPRFPGAEVIDGRHKALLPGVVNCHAHLAAAVARGFNEDYGFPNRSGIRSPESLLSEEERTLMAVVAALHAIRTGTTTLIENTSRIAPEAEQLARTGLRWVFAESVNDRVNGGVMSPERFAAETTPVFSAQLREEGLQRVQDLFSAWHGRNDGKIQVFPAVGHTENASPELLRAIRAFAEQNDLGYTIHFNQTPAEVDYMVRYHRMRPAQYLDAADFLGPRLFAAHARYVDDSEVDLLARTDTLISHQASMAANRGVSPPIPALRAAGCRICLGSDNNNNDLFAVMKVAMLTERIRRVDEHPGMFPQPEDILYDAAMGGAQAIQMSESLGLLEVGRKADLIVLDAQTPALVPSGRILSAWLHNGSASDVESVVIDGEFIMRDRRILTVDEDAILAEARLVGDRVWAQVEANGPVEPPNRTGWR